MLSVLGMKLKRVEWVVWLFFNIDLCSATSIESSDGDLLNDMTEHKPILKNNQNTYQPRFGLTPKNRYTIPKNGALFLLFRLG